MDNKPRNWHDICVDISITFNHLVELQQEVKILLHRSGIGNENLKRCITNLELAKNAFNKIMHT